MFFYLFIFYFIFSHTLLQDKLYELQHVKTTKKTCAPSQLRSAWASAQSDQSLLSAWRSTGSLATHWEHSAALIRLGGCPGWPESSLGAHELGLILFIFYPNIFFICTQTYTFIARFCIQLSVHFIYMAQVKNEPCHEKTCLRGLWPGKTQPGQLSYRDKLESWNFGYRN